MTVPILIMTHSRANSFKKVLFAVSKYTSDDILIVCDGPRDTKDIKEQKEIFSLIKLYKEAGLNIRLKKRETNLGCKLGVISAINDFFELYSSGIILEDDCIPSQKFFNFCEDMLQRYEYDKRIGSICGTNIIENEVKLNHDITYTSISLMWGWATWKNRWQEYDCDMISWNPNNKIDIFYQLNIDTYLKRAFWDRILNHYKFDENANDAWDYQWILSMAMNSMLCVVPRRNLISNQGFDDAATHTKSIKDNRNSLPTSSSFQAVNFPNTVCANRVYDNQLHLRWFKINFLNFIKRKIKNFLFYH